MSRWCAAACLLFVGCATQEPAAPPPAPVVDAAVPDLGITITMGSAQFEAEDAGATDAAPDAAVDAAVELSAAARRKAKYKAIVAYNKRLAKRKAAEAAKLAAKAPSGAATKAAAPRTPTAMGTIRRHMKDVERCYSPVAQRDDTVQGRIVVQWTLSASGKPSAVRLVSDSLSDKSVGRCIKRKAKGWQFPPPGGGVSVVTYPFNLRVQ